MKVCFSVIAVLFLLASCVQSKKAILGAQAFYKQSFAGARLNSVDMNGNEGVTTVDTVRIIYLKTAIKKPGFRIDTVFIGQRLFKAILSPIPEKNFVAGTTKATNETVYLKASKNTTWWQFVLYPFGGVQANNKKGVLIKGFAGKLPVDLTINTFLELKPDVRL